MNIINRYTEKGEKVLLNFINLTIIIPYFYTKLKNSKETPSTQLPRNNSVVCEDISANNKIHVFT